MNVKFEIFMSTFLWYDSNLYTCRSVFQRNIVCVCFVRVGKNEREIEKWKATQETSLKCGKNRHSPSCAFTCKSNDERENLEMSKLPFIRSILVWLTRLFMSGCTVSIVSVSSEFRMRFKYVSVGTVANNPRSSVFNRLLPRSNRFKLFSPSNARSEIVWNEG